MPGSELAIQVGIGGTLALLVLREVFAFLKGRSAQASNECQRQLQDLWDWHNLADDEGVKVWYVRKSLERSIDALAENVKHQTEMLEALKHEIQRGGQGL